MDINVNGFIPCTHILHKLRRLSLLLHAVFTVVCAVHRALLSVDDLVHEPGVAVGVVGALWGLRAVTRVLTSHLAPLLPDPHVLILDSAVFVWMGTHRFGGTLTVQFTAEGTLSTIDVLVSEDLLTETCVLLVARNGRAFGGRGTVAFVGTLDRAGESMDDLVLVHRDTQALVPNIRLYRGTLGFGWTVTHPDATHCAYLAKYGLVLVDGFT